MKTIFVFLLSVIFVQSSFSQMTTVHKNDGTSTEFQLSQIGSITFSTSTTLPMTVYEKSGTSTEFQLSQIDSVTFSTSTIPSMTVHTNSGTSTEFQLSQIDSITFSNSTTPTTGFTGDFLAWTSSDDPAHYFNFVRVNGQNGTVTNIGGFDFFPAMAYALDGTLYGIASDLHIINPANGATVKIGDFRYGDQDYILMGAAAFSTDGTLYVMALSDSVFTVNLSNAALTYVGKPTALVSDLEFASNGTLYASFADLFILNPSDMSTITKIGSTETFLSCLTFGAGATLFGIDIFPSTHIYSVNLNTGAAAAVTATLSSGLSSLVAERTTASPMTVESNIAAKIDRVAARRTLEELHVLERAVRQFYRTRLMNRR